MSLIDRLATAALIAAVTVNACGGSGAKPDGGIGWTGGGGNGGTGTGGLGGSHIAGPTVTGAFSAAVNNNVDILFLIDDSSSMGLQQGRLMTAFPSFITALRGLPIGLPNLHLAVVSSDMGAGNNGIAGCTGTGKAGIFQYTARSTCSATNLQAGATFISDIGGVRNYTGNIEDVFKCIGTLGETGCGFEQQFAAITRALGADGLAAPAENQGFLRPDAYLAIVMLTNEDDCSAANPATFYNTGDTTLASTLGPPSNFRCNEFGHICDGAPPRRTAPNGQVTDTVTYTSCSATEGGGMLKTVADTAMRIKALKADPSQILVAAITGPQGPYQVHWKNPSLTDSGPWPEVTHSCIATDSSFADPSVRISKFTELFGAQGLSLSICDTSFAPALMRIAQEMGRFFEPPCITALIAQDASGKPNCFVAAHTANGSGGFVDAIVPACADAGGTPPCWELVASPTCGGQNMQIRSAPATSQPVAQNYSYECGICTPGMTDPTRGCP